MYYPPSLGFDNTSKCTLCHGSYECPPGAALASWATDLPRGGVYEPKHGRVLARGTHNSQVNTGQHTGAMHKGNGISSQWHGPWLEQHINLLALQAIHLTLLHFRPELGNHNVLERTDSRVAAAYINRQEDWGSPRLY